MIGESEVNNFDVFILVEKKVFWFEVAVDDAVLVDVLDTGEDLLHEANGLLLVESLPLDDVLE